MRPSGRRGRSGPASLAALLTLALLGAAPAAAQPRTGAAEAKMRTAVAAEVERNVALLRRLVEQNSGTLNIAGVAKVGAMVRAELEPLGFVVRWEDMSKVGRAGHLVAHYPGDGRGKRILLIGHLDTVFEAGSPFRSFQRSGDRAAGPGVNDDKGGMVVIVAALRAMRAAGKLKNADITVYLTGDEERTGAPTEVARAGLIAAGKRADVALEYEGLGSLNGRDYATVARRGTASWELRTTGKSGHSSRLFSDRLGFGAIYEMARILHGFAAELRRPDVTFNVGMAAGGSAAGIDEASAKASASGKINIVPESAVARGDLRTVTPEQEAEVRAGMAAIVARHLPGTGATLSFSDGKPAMPANARNRALLARLNEVNRDLGLGEMGEVPPSERGGADSGFVAPHVATLGGLGAAGGGSHSEDEWVDLASIPRQALRSAVLISRLAAEPR